MIGPRSHTVVKISFGLLFHKFSISNFCCIVDLQEAYARVLWEVCVLNTSCESKAIGPFVLGSSGTRRLNAWYCL